MALFHAMRGTLTGKIVTLNSSGEAAAFANAGDVDGLHFGKRSRFIKQCMAAG